MAVYTTLRLHNTPDERDFHAAHSSAGSLARTVHDFRKISGDRFWPGAIACAAPFRYPGRD